MDLPVEEVFRPANLDEALEFLTDRDEVIPIAGGTDLSVQLRAGHRTARTLLDISHVIPAAVTVRDEFVEIGAGATMDAVVRSSTVRTTCPALHQAARRVGAWPIQCRATLGGNLANASPAADTAPPLLVADAQIVLLSTNGPRRVALEDFFTGPGTTVLRPDELIHSVLLPRTGTGPHSLFDKIGPRREQIISVVSVAVGLDFDDHRRIRRAAIAFGAVAPTPKRAPTVENMLAGVALDASTIAAAADAVQQDIAPIDDVRAPAWYRRVAAATTLRRLLEEAVDV